MLCIGSQLTEASLAKFRWRRPPSSLVCGQSVWGIISTSPHARLSSWDEPQSFLVALRGHHLLGLFCRTLFLTNHVSCKSLAVSADSSNNVMTASLTKFDSCLFIFRLVWHGGTIGNSLDWWSTACQFHLQWFCRHARVLKPYLTKRIVMEALSHKTITKYPTQSNPNA